VLETTTGKQGGGFSYRRTFSAPYVVSLFVARCTWLLNHRAVNNNTNTNTNNTTTYNNDNTRNQTSFSIHYYNYIIINTIDAHFLQHFCSMQPAFAVLVSRSCTAPVGSVSDSC
jgi:hypothetical protein